MKIKLKTIILIIASLSSPTFARESNPFGRVSLGAEIGSWKPNNLQAKASVSPFGVSGASPYIGLFLLSPWKGNMTFRATFGFWSQGEVKLAEVESVDIFSFLLDVKYLLVPESRFSPFVSYGAAAYMGRENRVSGLLAQVSRVTEIGYGANVGVGFDYLMGRHWGLGVEFCYHYVKFGKVVGLIDDYSGPKFTLGLYYLF